MPTKTLPDFSLGLNVDECDRKVIVNTCCLRLFQLGFKSEIGLWRQKASALDWFELLARAEELGVELRSGGKPYHLELHQRQA